jgi:hypothetical protein
MAVFAGLSWVPGGLRDPGAYFAQQLMGNPRKAVRCPFCATDDLKVVDVPWSAETAERWITCPHCREGMALRIKREWPKT